MHIHTYIISCYVRLYCTMLGIVQYSIVRYVVLYHVVLCYVILFCLTIEDGAVSYHVSYPSRTEQCCE